MKRKIICFYVFFLAITLSAYAYDYPSKGKKLHYEFKHEEIAFTGCKHKGDRGVLHCYDLKTNTSRLYTGLCQKYILIDILRG